MSKAHVLKRYSFLIWILFFVLSTKAEQQDYYFRQISLEQGLSQSRVQCIYRDHLGVIWIGTKWGLNSYDQSELKSYFHDREQPNSLPDNFIRFITEVHLHLQRNIIVNSNSLIWDLQICIRRLPWIPRTVKGHMMFL